MGALKTAQNTYVYSILVSVRVSAQAEYTATSLHS